MPCCRLCAATSSCQLCLPLPCPPCPQVLDGPSQGRTVWVNWVSGCGCSGANPVPADERGGHLAQTDAMLWPSTLPAARCLICPALQYVFSSADCPDQASCLNPGERCTSSEQCCAGEAAWCCGACIFLWAAGRCRDDPARWWW